MSGEYLGDFVGNETLLVVFDTFDSAGASVTMTGFDVTDIEIYKGASTVQRANDAGISLIDTDGIDIDLATGIHGFSVDLSNNSDAGFYAAGNDYYIVVSSVTIDSKVVRFIAARFSIQNRFMRGTENAMLASSYTAPDNAGIAAILADTGTTLNDKIDLIAAVTSQFTFTVANQVNSNVRSINSVTITGDGSATPFNV